ncbi:MAG: hypothetical protein K2M48_06245, partial [Clostridiales bacterium]|nr:hypothetical protein [Clostridiales bacterium]
EYYVEFTQSRLNLSVGDTYDLERVIDGNIRSYTFSSSDSSVASVSGTVLTARAIGSATLTVSARDTYEDTMRVVVSEEGLTIETHGELIQTVGHTSAVAFKANATGSVAESRIYWYVGDVRKEIKNAGESFYYTPTEAGEVVITAKCANKLAVCDSVTLRTYNAVEASGITIGNLNQSGEEFESLIFAADVKENVLNPDNYIEWRVDGKTVYAGADIAVEYTPKAGRHVVELFVNGVKRTVNGESEVVLLFSGSVVPTDVEVVFDNMYPHLYIRADVQGDMQVEIMQPNGTVDVYNKTTNPALFDENGFDAADFIRLCAVTYQMSYAIRVKSLGDGDMLQESDYSESFYFEQLPAAARPYIEDVYLDRDHYLTSDEEYVHAFEYYVITRNKNTLKPRIQFACYVGYDMTYTAKQMWNYAFRIGATSGNYTGRGAWLSENGKILNTEMTVNTVNNPSKQAYSESKSSQYNVQLHSNLPHINYDENKYRDEDYVFPIDTLEHTESVRYTDELYLAAQSKTRPVPVAGSAADTVYGMARNILRQIISDDMTDKQKAHAIYDWIMWQVTYDTPATKVQSNGEAYSAYYLEGVFGDGITPIGGVVYDPYAVCDGMSKAYSLMCNIEGIPCVRVSGMAGSSALAAGGHAWNKVYVDGAWYIVDCTWGDPVSTRRIGGVSADYEFALHDWLFVTDEMAEDTHYEPFMYGNIDPEWGECEIVYAPRTAKQYNSPYTEMVYNGTAINCEVASGENQKTRINEIMTAYAKSYKTMNTVYIPGYRNGYYSVNYQSIEIHFENKCTLSQSQLSSAVKSAVMNVLPRASVDVFEYDDNLVFVLVKA